MNVVLEFIKEKWAIIVIVLIILIGGTYIVRMRSEVQSTKNDILIANEQILENKINLSDLEKEFDAEVYSQTLESTDISAKKIGQEIIALDNFLTAYYKSNDPLPENEEDHPKYFERLELAKKEYSKIVEVKDTEYISTWKLNPDWNIKLESVVNYRNVSNIPIIFSLTTKDGTNAGLIYAIYNVGSYKITGVTRHYTNAGILDAVDVGGN